MINQPKTRSWLQGRNLLQQEHHIRNRMNRSIIALFGILTIVGGLLAACGSSTSATPTAATSGGAATSTMTGGAMAASPMTGSPMAMGDTSSLVSQTQTVGSYKLTLMIGSQEQMYTQQQFDQQHPTSGEVMVSGTMTMPEGTPMAGMGTTTSGMGTPTSGMAMGSTDTKHLEVHVADATGKTVTDATVTIEVIDNTAQNMSTNVPISTMYGVQQGMSDLHYGNNVTMPANRDYTVNVTVNGQQAVFKFHLNG